MRSNKDKIIFYNEVDEIPNEIYQEILSLQTKDKEKIITYSTKVTKNQFWVMQLTPKNKS